MARIGSLRGRVTKARTSLAVARGRAQYWDQKVDSRKSTRGSLARGMGALKALRRTGEENRNMEIAERKLKRAVGFRASRTGRAIRIATSPRVALGLARRKLRR